MNELRIKKRVIEDSVNVTESNYLEVKNAYDSLINLADNTNKNVLNEMDLKERMMFDLSLKSLEWTDKLNNIKFSIDSLEKLNK